MNHLPCQLAAQPTGALIGGEALARLAGMHLWSRDDHVWISVKNDLLLGLNLVTGLGLV